MALCEYWDPGAPGPRASLVLREYRDHWALGGLSAPYEASGPARHMPCEANGALSIGTTGPAGIPTPVPRAITRPPALMSPQ